MELKDFTGKTVDDAITEACRTLEVTSDRLYYEVVEKGTSGFLGFASKPAMIKACIKSETAETEESSDTASAGKDTSDTFKAADEKEEKTYVSITAKNDPKIFLDKVFDAMGMKVEIKTEVIGNEMDIELSGNDMGVLIGKRGQTLDSLQYLTSLFVNKNSDSYVRVKLDTENYRDRRKETLENLAKNIAYKVKRTKRPVSLEPMNPYERRIIHSALQNDKYVNTHSEGDEPFRKVVITYNSKS
ncbi:MAG: protein jag [Lachnospiraceae bacterium]|nr:protein jag [Lachnospiraceae bacterium]